MTHHHPMMMPQTPREAQLEEQNAALQAQVNTLQQELEALKQHNAVLRLKVDAMARKLFGRSSEKLDAAQLQMVFEALRHEPLDEDEAKNPAPPVAARASRRLKRPRRRSSA